MIAGRRARMLLVSGSAALALAGPACAGPPDSKEKSMSSEEEVTSSASRVGRPSPRAISFEGRRYEQIKNGERLGLGQRTGLLAVVDESSNMRVGAVRIYDYPREDGLEADAGDVFFVTMELDAGKREIVIESEYHDRFAYRIDDGSVHALP